MFAVASIAILAATIDSELARGNRERDLTEEWIPPGWLNLPSDPQARAILLRLLTRSAPELMDRDAAQPQPEQLSESFARSLYAAADDEAEIEVLAHLVGAYRPQVLQGRRKLLLRSIEDILNRLQADLPGTSKRTQAIADLLSSSDNRASKEAIPAIKRLINADREGEAEILAQTMLALNPSSPGYFNVTLLIKDENRRLRMQTAHFQRLAAMLDTSSDLAPLLARQLMQTNAFERALDFLTPRLADGDERLLLVAANVFFWLDRFEDAEAVGLRALQTAERLTQRELASLYVILARCRLANNDGLGAIDCLDKSRARRSDETTHFAEDFYANICAGRIKKAFSYYWDEKSAAALRSINPTLVSRDELESAYASGQAVPGHAGVTCIMGVGDEVRFGSMIPQIAELFEGLSVCCDRRIAPAFARTFPNVRFYGSDPARLASDIDPALASRLDTDAVEILQKSDHIADLKYFASILRKDGTVPRAQGGWLKPDQELVRRWRHRFDAWDKPCIGLFWRSSLVSHAAQHKQTKLSVWLASLPVDDVGIVPLQYDLTIQEQTLLEQDGRIFPLPASFDIKNDIEKTLALLSALPLIISLPGTTQHMAGAVGTPVLCPTHPFEAAWRRMPGYAHDLWATSVEIISGDAQQGLSGSIASTLKRLEHWIAD